VNTIRPVRFWREIFCLRGCRALRKARCPSRTRLDILAHHTMNVFGPRARRSPRQRDHARYRSHPARPQPGARRGQGAAQPQEAVLGDRVPVGQPTPRLPRHPPAASRPLARGVALPVLEAERQRRHLVLRLAGPADLRAQSRAATSLTWHQIG
jgi:hypothetical protein